MTATAERSDVAQVERQPTQLPSTQVTPPQMLALAVERGADMGQLEKLMDLQERWEAGEAKKAYIRAMNQFKSNPPKITKNKLVDFASKVGRTTYRHATLDHICDIIGEALGRVGISYNWDTNQSENGVVRVTCILTHEHGHSERTSLQAAPDQSGGKNGIQAVGSTVTYLQRYTLLAATGMAVEDQDDDANGADPQGGANTGSNVADVITPEEGKALIQLARQKGKDAEYVCQKAKISSIGELKKSRLTAAENHLKKLPDAQQGGAQ